MLRTLRTLETEPSSIKSLIAAMIDSKKGSESTMPFDRHTKWRQRTRAAMAGRQCYEDHLARHSKESSASPTIMSEEKLTLPTLPTFGLLADGSSLDRCGRCVSVGPMDGRQRPQRQRRRRRPHGTCLWCHLHVDRVGEEGATGDSTETLHYYFRERRNKK